MTASTTDHLPDTSVRPQDDLFGHVNGHWLATAEIPADRATFGSLDQLRDGAEEKVRSIVEQAAGQASEPGCDPVVGRVGDLFTSFMDTDTVDRRGTGPLAERLARVDGVDSPAALLHLLGDLGRADVPGLFGSTVWVDRGDPTRYLLHLSQGGLGLPDESYYRTDEHADLRQAYVEVVDALLGLVGVAAEGAGARVLALETSLAAAHWDRTACRDAVRTYNLTDHDALAALVPDIDAWFDGAGVDSGGRAEVVVGQPDALAAAGRLLAEVPLADWQDWLRWHLTRSAAPYLPEAVLAPWFAFYSTRLSGVPQLRARWKRALQVVDAAVGHDVGRLFVAEHFGPAAQQKMDELVANLVEAYRQRITDLAWMTPATRQRALDKLEAFNPKIGAPTTFPDTSGLEIRADDLLGNVHRAAEHETRRQLAKLGGPIDRTEWLMTPQTVNAYYNPAMNEIVFPAAILQEPFFRPAADDAENYGAIGAVIGHEIGHGFDDQGSRYDGAGGLADWWTDEDRAHFDTRAQALIAQFDALSPRGLPDARVNGGLTVGENIGDLGGVDIAHHAYRLSLGDGEAPVLDGATGDQRLFAAWARTWRAVVRPEEARRRLAVDPHSPPDLRAHVVRNVGAFHTAYGTAPGDGMWLDPSERVRIW